MDTQCFKIINKMIYIINIHKAFLFYNYQYSFLSQNERIFFS